MWMAGLFDVWDSPEGPLYTYTILTTDSSKRLQWCVAWSAAEPQEEWVPRLSAGAGCTTACPWCYLTRPPSRPGCRAKT